MSGGSSRIWKRSFLAQRASRSPTVRPCRSRWQLRSRNGQNRQHRCNRQKRLPEAEQTDEEAQALVRLQAALEVFQKMEGASKPPVPEGEPELGDFVILAKDVEPYGLCYAVITEAGEGRL